MNKIKLSILGLSSGFSQSGSFALVLGEQDGSRRLPIIIGIYEAQSIAIEMEKIIPNRPLTHDLFKSFAKLFEINITSVCISDLKEGVFFAKIICSQDNKLIEIDARPSDAIAIAIRFNVDIFINERILEEAGVVFDEDDESTLKVTTDTKVQSKASPLENMSSEELTKMMKDLIEKEDYEKAAQIRDILNKRN